MLFLQLASRILSCAHAQSFFDAAWRPSRPMRAVRTHVKFGQAFQRGAWVQCFSGIAIVVGWRCAHQCGSKLPDLPDWKNGPSMIGWRVCSRDLLLISSCFLFSVGHHGHGVVAVSPLWGSLCHLPMWMLLISVSAWWNPFHANLIHTRTWSYLLNCAQSILRAICIGLTVCTRL